MYPYFQWRWPSPTLFQPKLKQHQDKIIGTREKKKELDQINATTADDLSGRCPCPRLEPLPALGGEPFKLA